MDNNENELESSKIDFNSEFMWIIILFSIFGGGKDDKK